MKKYVILALTIVLTASLFTGCRERNDTGSTSAPTIMPTVEMPTVGTTETPTQTPTEMSTAPTMDTGAETEASTAETGTSDAPEGSGTDANRSRSRLPQMR